MPRFKSLNKQLLYKTRHGTPPYHRRFRRIPLAAPSISLPSLASPATAATKPHRETAELHMQHAPIHPGPAHSPRLLRTPFLLDPKLVSRPSRMHPDQLVYYPTSASNRLEIGTTLRMGISNKDKNLIHASRRGMYQNDFLSAREGAVEVANPVVEGAKERFFS